MSWGAEWLLAEYFTRKQKHVTTPREELRQHSLVIAISLLGCSALMSILAGTVWMADAEISVAQLYLTIAIFAIGCIAGIHYLFTSAR